MFLKYGFKPIWKKYLTNDKIWSRIGIVDFDIILSSINLNRSLTVLDIGGLRNYLKSVL